MKINNFTKAGRIYAQVKELDAEIIRIEKIAQTIGADKCNITVSIDIENLSEDKKKTNVDAVVEVTAADILNIRHSMPSFASFTMQATYGEKFKFSDIETFLILSAILKIKCDRRDALLSELKELGVV